MTDFTKIPFERIVKFGQQTMLDEGVFSISWILGRFCNYKCSYCWPYANSSFPDYQELSVYTNTIQSIKTQANINGFTKFHWSFSGGEPTAYKHLHELLKQVDGDSIHMTTNLSPGMQWWDRWLATTKNSRRRSLTASFHAEFANEDEFTEKCKYLVSKGVFVTINQVMEPNPHKFEESYWRSINFYNNKINVTLKPQSDPTASRVVDGYDDVQIETMRKGLPLHYNERDVLQVKLIDDTGKDWYIDQAERFNSFGFNKFTNWHCNSGYQSVIIRSNEVKRSYSCHDEMLGTLTEGFKLFDKPKICITPSCVSSADSKIPKSKL